MLAGFLESRVPTGNSLDLKGSCFGPVAAAAKQSNPHCRAGAFPSFSRDVARHKWPVLGTGFPAARYIVLTGGPHSRRARCSSSLHASTVPAHRGARLARTTARLFGHHFSILTRKEVVRLHYSAAHHDQRLLGLQRPGPATVDQVLHTAGVIIPPIRSLKERRH